MSNLVLGIDIGGTNTGFALVDEYGKIHFKENLATLNYVEFIDLAKHIFSIIANAVSTNSELLMPISIGVGAPNGNYFRGTIDFAPNLRWEGIVDVKYAFDKFFHVPTCVTNDANAAAMGEHRFGSAKGMNDFVIVTLGTGLGSGFFVNGKLMYGHHSYGGEMGHIIVESEGRPCGCGRKGCLETYSSVTGLKRNLLELISSGSESELIDFKLEDLSGKMIEEAAGRGDKASLEAFEMAGKYLGKAMANVAAITDPEAFILFGGLAQAKELIFKPTTYHFQQNLLEIFKNKIKVLPSALSGNNAAILGAAALAWDSVL
jgi:glucokinase